MRKRSGVWFSDEPLGDNEGVEGDTLLEVSINATEATFHEWEWVEEGKGYREWFIPAAVINPLVREIRIVPE